MMWSRPPALGLPSDLEFDLFVSYRHADPDLTWVRHRLVPSLRARGMAVCLDVEEFALGAPLVSEMGRAVERSRYTLAVVTPAYLGGVFAMLEAVMAQRLGVDEGRSRLIVAVREGIDGPPDWRALILLDVRHDDELVRAVDRLERALARGAPNEIR